MNAIGVILKNVLALSSSIMAVNGHKSASIHHKSAPRGSGVLTKAFWSKAMRLCKKNGHL